jgi:hypothetical protein
MSTMKLGALGAWSLPPEFVRELAETKKEEPVAETERHEFATEEGQRLIGGKRMEHYGPPQNNLNDIGAAWTVYAVRALETKGHLDGTDASAMMVIMKAIRQARGYHRDSTVDICGYAGLMEALNDPVAFEQFVRDAADKMDESKRQAFLDKLLGFPPSKTEATKALAKDFGLPDTWIEEHL